MMAFTVITKALCTHSRDRMGKPTLLQGTGCCSVLSLLDAGPRRIVFLSAKGQTDGEDLLVGRALLADELVFGLEFVEACQLIEQAHRCLLFGICHVVSFLNKFKHEMECKGYSESQ